MFFGHTLRFILFIYFFFIAKVLIGPYFTYVFVLQRPRSNCTDAHYTEPSNTFDTSFLEIINKQSNLEWKIDKVGGLVWNGKQIKWPVWVFWDCLRWFSVFRRINLTKAPSCHVHHKFNQIVHLNKGVMVWFSKLDFGVNLKIIL